MELSREQRRLARIPDHFTDPALIAHLLAKRVEHGVQMRDDLAVEELPQQYRQLRDNDGRLAALIELASVAGGSVLAQEAELYLGMASSEA